MKLTARDMTMVSLFVALAVVAAVLVRFGSAIVPFSLMPFVVLLAGAVLGPKLGAIAMGVYVLLGLIGLPVFATAPFGGFAYVLKPSFGYLIGYIAAAYLTGWVAHRSQASLARYIVASLIGLIVIYLFGIPYLYAILNYVLGKDTTFIAALQIGFIPFILPDIIKAVVASALAYSVVKRLPRPIQHTTTAMK